MAFEQDRRLGGMLYTPRAEKNQPRKHDCPDCHACQLCGDDRCGVCRHKAQPDANTDLSPNDGQENHCSKQAVQGDIPSHRHGAGG